MIRGIWWQTQGKLHLELAPQALIAKLRARDGLVWIDLDGDAPVEFRQVADLIGAHPLAIEDSLHRGQFPKLDNYGEHLFLVVHEAECRETSRLVPPSVPHPLGEVSRSMTLELSGEISVSREFPQLAGWSPQTTAPPGEAPLSILTRTHEIAIFMGQGFLVTYHLDGITSVAAAMDRAARDAERLHSKGAAALLHLVLDRVAESFRPVIDIIEERLEQLETEVLRRPHRRHQSLISRLKRDLLAMRRVVGPQRDLIARISREPHPQIPAAVRPYLGDVHDRMIHIMEQTELARDLIISVRDAYLAGLSNRNNEVVKVLTLFATALLPLNVMAGIYGMNFEFIPLADHPWGFFLMLGAMALAGATAVMIFRRSHWI